MKKIEISDFNTMKKFDDFLKLLDFYHVERCEHVDFSNCLFIINLGYLYAQNSVNQQDSVVPLHNFCRMRINQFYCCRLFLKTLGALEKQRVLAERDFHKTLDYGIKHRTHHHSNHWKRYQHHWHHQGPLDLRLCKFNKRWIRKNYFDGRKKTRYQLVFFILKTLHLILSLMMGTIGVTVKKMINVKYVKFQWFLVILRKM